MDKKIYNKQSIKSNPTDRMLSILMFICWTEESETKSNRTSLPVLNRLGFVD